MSAKYSFASDMSLRRELIRLAYQKKEFRNTLLPLVTSTSVKTADKDLDLNSLMEDFEKGLGGDVEVAFNTYRPDRKDLQEFLERVGTKIVLPPSPAPSAVSEIIRWLTLGLSQPDWVKNAKNIEATKEVFYHQTSLINRQYRLAALPKTIAWDIPKAMFESTVKAIKALGHNSENLESLAEAGIINDDYTVKESLLKDSHQGRGFATLPELASRLYQDKPETPKTVDNLKSVTKALLNTLSLNTKIIPALADGAIGFVNGVGSLFGMKPYSTLSEASKRWEKDTKKMDNWQYSNQILNHYFEEYMDATHTQSRSDMKEGLQKEIDLNKEEIAKELKKALTDAIEGKDLKISKIESDQSIADAKDIISQSIINQAASLKDKLKDMGEADKKQLLEQISQRDFSKDVEAFSQEIPKSIKPNLYKKEGMTDVAGIIKGDHEGRSHSLSRISPESLSNSISDLNAERRREKTEDKGKSIFQKMFDKAKNLLTGKGKKKKQETHSKGEERRFIEESLKRKQYPNPNPKGKKKQIAWSTLQSMATDYDNPNQQKAIDIIRKERARLKEQYKKRSQKSKKKAKETKRDVPKKVRELAQKLEKEQGRDPGYAFAVAWSVYCKYENPDSSHCKQDDYFHGKGKQAFFCKNLIRFAYENPEYRKSLLPLIKDPS